MGNNLCSVFIINTNPQIRVWQCPFLYYFCTLSGHFLARPGDAQNLPKETAPAVGVSITNALVKVTIFGPDQGTAQNLPKIAGLRKRKKTLHGRTWAHFWTSGSKLDKTVPAIIAQFGHEFRIFQSSGTPQIWSPKRRGPRSRVGKSRGLTPWDVVSKHASSSDFLLNWGLDLSSQTWSPNARQRARLHQLGGAPGDHIKLRAILGGRRKVVGFHENDLTLRSGGLQFLSLIRIFSSIFW